MLIKTPFFANATRVVTLALAMGAVCVTAATADVKLKFDKNGRDSVRVGGDHVKVTADENGYDGVSVGGNNARGASQGLPAGQGAVRESAE